MSEIVPAHPVRLRQARVGDFGVDHLVVERLQQTLPGEIRHSFVLISTMSQVLAPAWTRAFDVGICADRVFLDGDAKLLGDRLPDARAFEVLRVRPMIRWSPYCPRRPARTRPEPPFPRRMRGAAGQSRLLLANTTDRGQCLGAITLFLRWSALSRRRIVKRSAPDAVNRYLRHDYAWRDDDFKKERWRCQVCTYLDYRVFNSGTHRSRSSSVEVRNSAP